MKRISSGIIFFLFSLGGCLPARSANPHWIWPVSFPDRNESGETSWNEPVAVPKGGLKKATLRVTADFAAVKISVNGRRVAELEAYDPVREIDLRHYLNPGSNEIRFDATAAPGPSAVAAMITLKPKNGEAVTFFSGKNWLNDRESIDVLDPVDSRRWALNVLPQVSQIAEYNQWKEAKSGVDASFSRLPEGFEIEHLRSAREGEDSWVSLVFDNEGRLIVAREQKGLLRFTLSGPNADEIKAEVINETLEECRGLLWLEGVLYANANDSKGLYRLRDLDGDDQFEEVTLLRRTEGSVGHGRNDLALGPDGRIHAIHGDVVLVPEDASRLIVPEKSAPKALGHQVSTAPGKENDWRIHNRGLRNPYGIDFNPHGEAFTYDADNEGDIGLPFYRPTRINHLVSGANYGWHQDRENTRNLTVYAPDSVPTTFDVGRGSPTAVKFGTRSNFPRRYREALFALDWAYGRILEIQLVPRGASYHGSGSVFLQGRPLNVTDLDFDEKGDLYFITGGRKTQAGLYRIRHTGDATKQEKPTTQAIARNEFSAEARSLRKQLEASHGGRKRTEQLDSILRELGNPDPWIRNAARVALESQPLTDWKETALSGQADLGGLIALLAWVRVADDSMPVLEKLATMLKFSGQWSRDEKLTALRIMEISDLATYPDKNAIGPIIRAWITTPSDPVSLEVIRILAALDSPELPPLGIRLATAATNQLVRLHYIEMLSESSAGWTPELRDTYFQALAHAKRYSYGDRLMPAFFKTVQENALAKIEDTSEQDRFRKRFESEEPEPLPEIKPRSFVKNWKVSDFTKDTSPRDLKNGRAMFDAALCSRCHVAKNQGRPVEPDLTQIASRFSQSDLLDSVINPSNVVAEVHRNVVIKKNDGSTLIGRIVQNDYRKSMIYLSTNPYLADELTEIPKSEIESYEESPVSPMPPGLLNTLSRDDVLDLMAWLQSEG